MAENKDETISTKIKEYREKLNISELDMATKIGLPMTFYRVYEQTPTKFDEGLLKKTADVFGCTLEDLGIVSE